MGKFIITESEKKSILNLYREKNIIVEQTETPKELPYGLKSTSGNNLGKIYEWLDIINFNEVFGFDVKLAYSRLEDDGHISLGVEFQENLFSVGIDTTNLSFDKVKNILLKLKNNTFSPSDLNPRVDSKSEELLNSLLNNKISNYKIVQTTYGGAYSKHIFINEKEVTIFLYIRPTNGAENKISHIDYSTNWDTPYMRVYLDNGKKFYPKEFSLSTDETGKLSLNFSELESNLQGEPLFTKTKKRASQTTLRERGYWYLKGDKDQGREDKFVKIGDRGYLIKTIQQGLLQAGYDNFNITKDKKACKSSWDRCDGIFGKGTRDAVIKFQTDNGLKPDGIFGPSTAKALSNNENTQGFDD